MESRKEPNKDQEDDERMDQSAPVKPPEEVVGRTEESHEGMELGGPPTPLEEVGGRAQGNQESHQSEVREGKFGGEAPSKPDALDAEMEDVEQELREELSKLNDLPMHPVNFRSKEKAPKGNLSGRGKNAKLIKRPKP